MGIEGYPFANEWPFYVFEAVPMLFAVTIFCLWYPPAYVPRNKFGSWDEEVGKPEVMTTTGTGRNTPAMRSAAATPMVRSAAGTPMVRSAAPSRAQSRVPSRAPSPHREQYAPKASSERYA